jgi:hypothetical protein
MVTQHKTQTALWHSDDTPLPETKPKIGEDLDKEKEESAVRGLSIGPRLLPCDLTGLREALLDS